mmetsp:Transcript_41974/g.80295  ORF Transcript_41974/g.80295 Transcript_41974/m.80295 type:complete len:261 (+) Transcript_41974:477-1259(+)
MEVVEHAVATHVPEEELAAGLQGGERGLHDLQQIGGGGEVHGHSVAHDGVEDLVLEPLALVRAAQRRGHDVLVRQLAELRSGDHLVAVVHRLLRQVARHVALAPERAPQHDHPVAAPELQRPPRLQRHHPLARPLHPLPHHVQLVRDARSERVVVPGEVEGGVRVDGVLTRVGRVVYRAPGRNLLQVLLRRRHLVHLAALLDWAVLALLHPELFVSRRLLRRLLLRLLHHQKRHQPLLGAVAVGVDARLHHRLGHSGLVA